MFFVEIILTHFFYHTIRATKPKSGNEITKSEYKTGDIDSLAVLAFKLDNNTPI
jgi:hypothetical protein